jgi:peptidoglycan hydrolase CwlO-like protein
MPPEGNTLGFRLGFLAALVGAVILANQVVTAAPGFDPGPLAAQRQTLQQQAQGVMGARGLTVARLLEAQDRLADLRRHLEQNSVWLDELQKQQAALTVSIKSTRERLQVKRAALGSLTRQQYKTSADGSMSEIFFGSDNFGQVVDRIVANEAVSNRSHAAILEFQATDAALTEQSASLRDKQAEAVAIQDHLITLKAQVQSQAADYQAQVNSLDKTASDLLGRINAIDAAIAAANRPPGGGGGASQQAMIVIIQAAAARYGANGDQMVRVARCESGLNPRAYSASSGASGLFQFMPGTFYGHGGKNIWDPYDQSNIAAQMFAQGQASAWTCR